MDKYCILCGERRVMNKNGGKHVDKFKKIRNLCQNMWITLVIILVWILVGNVDRYVQESGEAPMQMCLQYDWTGRGRKADGRELYLYGGQF